MSVDPASSSELRARIRLSRNEIAQLWRGGILSRKVEQKGMEADLELHFALVAYRRRVAERRLRRFRDQEYWGRPVAGFGDPVARLLIVGLAPAAHGANRASFHPSQRNTQTGFLTTRMFARIFERAGRFMGKEKFWRSLTDPTSAV
jgi:hypothetical protein